MSARDYWSVARLAVRLLKERPTAIKKSLDQIQTAAKLPAASDTQLASAIRGSMKTQRLAEGEAAGDRGSRGRRFGGR
ncbi:hypothetical protein CHLRE_12g530934v5 [Chlamydomonas reinhardtii]|uniref:Uncharacterized protein n=1 Tax=Chlamydomonas reinhardtii TaxID=3055 RepID=A8IVZ1_CHLRE|nr:uncharacterized protein CHLRE_12g530934v5 [Chlamydomonas reinhardtii]PNW75544.1 hypothetical protein CHLRE_12g530934v5 [Chlamydomonas reinhardtii]|eukprot:XP_001692924.1 predicted protein [Chlamydomonas reinhardtii]